MLMPPSGHWKPGPSKGGVSARMMSAAVGSPSSEALGKYDTIDGMTSPPTRSQA
jgi:hypothetical protein